MELTENTSRPSGLRPPSTRTQLSGSVASQALHEMTESQHNARAQQPSSMLPPPAAGFKRSMQYPVTQPEAKRQTLVEKAAEYPPRSGTASSQSSRSSVKALSLKDATKTWGTSTSGLPRTAAHGSNVAHGSSTGIGGRPPSRTHGRTRSNTRMTRPATSMGTRDDNRSQNGTMPKPQRSLKPQSSFGSLQHCKVRGQDSGQDTMVYEKPLPAAREASICERLSRLDINNKSMSASKDGKTRVSRCPSPSPPSGSPTPDPKTPRRTRFAAQSQQQNWMPVLRGDPVVTLTPSQRPVRAQLDVLNSVVRLALATPGSALSVSPIKAPYLTKDSDIRGFIATDIDERLGKFDTELQKMKEIMDSTAIDKDRFMEELDTARKRATQLQYKKDELQDHLDDATRELQSKRREVQYLTEDLNMQKQRFQDEYDQLGVKHSRVLEEERRMLSLEVEKQNDLLRQFEERLTREADAKKEQLVREMEEQRQRFVSMCQEKELEVQRISLELHQSKSLLTSVDDDLRRSREQVEDHERTISRLSLKVAQLEHNAQTLQEAYGSSENRKDQEIGDMSRQMQELSKRAETAERQADGAEKEARRRIEASRDEFDAFKQAIQKRLVLEEEKRRKLFEQVQDLKGNIRVMCRIRPPGDKAPEPAVDFDMQPSEYDEDKFAGVVVPTEKDHPQEEGKKVAGKSPQFNFERVFDPCCNNNEVFDEISQLVQSVVDGKKVCIFCYGQTGSGKTYTMSNQSTGPDGDEDLGIIPRARQMVFGEVERLSQLGWEYSVEGSYLEVYKNKLFDLLEARSANPKPLEVKKLSDELEIKNHDFTRLNGEEDLEEMVRTAENNRHVAETNMNRASSRSHSILVLKIRGKKAIGDGRFKTREGTLNLIDLAGSESVGRSGATGEVAEEGRQINMSLTHLGTVLKQLGEGRRKESVDFSSYTLTQLLRPSLGEKCRTLMFVMVSPLKDNVKETISSLKFAENAQKVKQVGGSRSGTAKRSK